MLKYSKDEKGQGLVEYALIIVLIALVVIVSLSLVPPPVANTFNNIASTLADL
jgi:pilus assembly protein Flp/PilA